MGNLGSKKKFCAKPFEHFEVLPDGQVAPCHSHWTDQRLGNIYLKGIEEIWNSDIALRMRTSILDGSFEYCNKDRCRRFIDQSLPFRNDIDESRLFELVEGSNSLVRVPRHIYLANDPKDNSNGALYNVLETNENNLKFLEDIPEKFIFSILKEEPPSILSISGLGGDPLASDYYKSILNYLSENNFGDIELRLYTDGRLMNEENWTKYKGLEKYFIKINVSLDAASKFSYSQLRPTGSWNDILENLYFIKKLRYAGSIKNYSISMVVDSDNYHEMKNFYNLGSDLSCDHIKFIILQKNSKHSKDSFRMKNIADVSHPENKVFLEVLRDPVFLNSCCQFIGMKKYLDLAVQEGGVYQCLIDDLGREPSEEELIEYFNTLSNYGFWGKVLELATAVMHRNNVTPALLNIAGMALYQMGAYQHAQGRFIHALTMDPQDKIIKQNLEILLNDSRFPRLSYNDVVKLHSHNVIKDRFQNEGDPEAYMMEYLGELDNSKLLEIGSRKIVAPIDKDKLPTGTNYIGFDIIDGPNVDIVGDAHALSSFISPESIDAIISKAVFEHIAMPWRVALEINKVLKVGGLAYIATHHVYPTHEMPWDFWRYGYDALGTIFSPETGFKIIQNGISWSAQITPFGSSNLIEQNLEHYLFSSILVEKIEPYNENKFHWELGLEDVLPKNQFYPKGTYQLEKEAKEYGQEKEYFPPITLNGDKFLSEYISRLQKITFGKGLFTCGPDTEIETFLCQMPTDWDWETLRIEKTDVKTNIFEKVEQYDFESFDAIVALDVLSHVPFPWMLAPKLTKLLRKGGSLFSREIANRGHQEGYPDFWRFTYQSQRLVYNKMTGLEYKNGGFSDRIFVVPDQAKKIKKFSISETYRYSFASFTKKKTSENISAFWGNLSL